MNNEAIQVRNLHKSFQSGKFAVLKGIDLNFPTGSLTYILGPSGTGKSVLLKHILGLLRPDEGSILVHGKNITSMRGDELTEHRQSFGMLFQNSALFDDLSLFENVAFPLREHTKFPEAEIKRRVESTLSSLGISTGFEKLPSEISGGMKKRVALARAIIREPSILLYDEPTTGLDPVTRKTVDELIAQIKTQLKVTSIVISHDIPSALLLADYIAFLFQGKVIFWGTPAEFKMAPHEKIQEFLQAELRSMTAFRDLM